MARRIRTIYRRVRGRVSRRGGKIPVMGIVTAGSLVASVLGSSAGAPKPEDNPIRWMRDGNWNNAMTKLQFNLSKPSTYVPVLIPLAVWVGGRIGLGRVPIGRKITLF